MKTIFIVVTVFLHAKPKGINFDVVWFRKEEDAMFEYMASSSENEYVTKLETKIGLWANTEEQIGKVMKARNNTIIEAAYKSIPALLNKMNHAPIVYNS